jgi:hypothetical protein
MIFDKNIIEIHFDKNIIKNINILYFKENKEIIYYNNNHLNYIYKTKKNDIEYTFYGFFKNDYFTIILDSYSIKLDTNIQSKFVYLINLNWVLKEINDDLKLWILDGSKINNLYMECLIAPFRKKIFSHDIEDLLNITEYNKTNINIDIQKNFEIKKIVSSSFNF